VGLTLGLMVGLTEGFTVGVKEGFADGLIEGFIVGLAEVALETRNTSRNNMSKTDKKSKSQSQIFVPFDGEEQCQNNK
jgi:hypothetical protein